MRKAIAGILLAGTAIIAIVSFIYLQQQTIRKENGELVNPLISVVAENPTPMPKATAEPIQVLSQTNQSALDSLFQTYQEQYPEIEIAISVVNINKNKTTNFNPDRLNIGASTTKLFTASAFLSELEKGKYSYDSPMGSYNTKFQLEQMINQSNNNSWELFYQLLSRNKIEKYAHSIGSRSFDISENALKATDMTNYLTKLYKNELHERETSQYLLSLMQDTNEETFIPKNSEGFTLYHKNGQLEDIVNEAVLAVKGTDAVSIAIYTDGKGKWEYDKRARLISSLIRDILNVK